MEELDKRTKITIMIAIMAGMLFAALNQTIVGTALPRIISELGGMEYYSWVFTIYMLTSSVSMLLAGKLSDMYGRKIFLLVGLVAFMIGTFLCGTSGSIIQLIVWRGVQGIGGGIIMTCAIAAVGDLFSPRERGRWQGLMGAVFGLASVVGPTLGGYIVDHMHWKWVFWVFLPVGLIALYLIARLFPKTAFKPAKVDYLGAVFVTGVIVPLLLALSWGGSKYQWGSGQIIGLFAGSAVCVLLFALVEKRASSPLMPLELFKNSIFNVSNLVGFMTGFAMFGAVMYIPLFVQGVIGTSATQSGAVSMPMTLSLVVCSTLVGQFTSRTGKYKLMGILGMAIVAVGMYLLSLMSMSTSNWTAALNMIVIGAGLGLSMPVFMLAVQNAVSPAYLGVTSSAVQLFRQIGGTVGVAVMGTLMSTKIQDEMAANLPAAVKQFLANPAVADKAQSLMNPQLLVDPSKIAMIKEKLPAAVAPLFDQLMSTLRTALSSGLDEVFKVGFFVALAGLVLSLFLKEIPLRTSNRVPTEEEPKKPDLVVTEGKTLTE